MQQPNSGRNLGSQIEAARERKSKKNGGYTLYRLAKDAKMDYSQLHRVVHNKSMPSRDKLVKICAALGCSLEEAREIFEATEYRAPSSEDLERSPQDRIATAV